MIDIRGWTNAPQAHKGSLASGESSPASIIACKQASHPKYLGVYPGKLRFLPSDSTPSIAYCSPNGAQRKKRKSGIV